MSSPSAFSGATFPERWRSWNAAGRIRPVAARVRRIVWAPAAVGLFLGGHAWKAVFLVAWGTLLVHPVDNLLRPYLISSVTRVPFLLVMFGALGGLAAFGLVGLFIGPVILGVASAIWREWATEPG